MSFFDLLVCHINTNKLHILCIFAKLITQIIFHMPNYTEKIRICSMPNDELKEYEIQNYMSSLPKNKVTAHKNPEKGIRIQC